MSKETRSPELLLSTRKRARIEDHTSIVVSQAKRVKTLKQQDSVPQCHLLELPIELFELILTNQTCFEYYIFCRTSHQLRCLVLSYLSKTEIKMTGIDIIKQATRYGISWTTFEWLWETENLQKGYTDITLFNAVKHLYQSDLTEIAAQFGHLHLLDMFLLGTFVMGDLYSIAGSTGNIDLLKWLIKNLPFYHGTEYESLIRSAASSGQLSFLKWLNRPGSTGNEMLDLKIPCIQHILISTNIVAESAVSSGQMHIVEWSYKNHLLHYSENLLVSAAENGHFHIIRYIHTKLGWQLNDYRLCSCAARANDLETLQWLRENGCPWDKETCYQASQHNYANLFTWAITNGCPYSVRSWSGFALHGNLEMLKWAFENKYLTFTQLDACWVHTYIMTYAARNNHFAILKWAKDQGCKLCNQICIETTDLAILQWARENGCDWSTSVCSEAAKKKCGDILKWALKNGCDYMGTKISKKLVKTDQIDLLKWYISHGYIWDSSILPLLYDKGHIKVVEWICINKYRPCTMEQPTKKLVFVR